MRRWMRYKVQFEISGLCSCTWASESRGFAIFSNFISHKCKFPPKIFLKKKETLTFKKSISCRC